jgi:hypothetical protein
MPSAPPPLLKYISLAEVYEYYVNEYVLRSPIDACCGCRIHCSEHHFIHVVKLTGPNGEALWFPNEKEKILTTVDGFGNYSHDAIRARRLLFTLECMRYPDEVFRPTILRTADRAYIKDFGDAALPYPFTVVLVRLEKDGRLTLCTGQPVRRSDIRRWRNGEKLWPK